MRKIARSLLLALLCALSACSVTYQFDPIEAWVVDAETGLPIEGAVVTANWELVKGSLDGERYHSQLEVRETVTDRDGRFHFEGFSKVDKSGAELRESDPQIIVFKPGYAYQRITSSYVDGGASMSMTRRLAAANGTRIKLRKQVVDTSKTPLTLYDGLRLYYKRIIDDCHWKSIPHAMVTMDREYKRAKAEHPTAYVDLVRSSTIESSSSKCGSADYLFKGKQ